MKKANLCLGSVKFGDPDYGFSNKRESFSFDEILSECLKLGIEFFDTSPRYMNSELILGKFFLEKKINPFVSTKIDNLVANNKNTPKVMRGSIQNSLERLNKRTIDLCYLHQNDIEIISDKYVIKGLNLLKEEGLIKEAGTSIYSTEELAYTIESLNYEWIQAPINILDVSFYNKIMSYNSTIKIAARSIFLQGIIFNKSRIKDLITESELAIQSIDRIDLLAKKYDMSFKELAVGYLFNLKNLSMIIFGSTSIENINFANNQKKLNFKEELMNEISAVSSDPKSWTNPRDWMIK